MHAFWNICCGVRGAEKGCVSSDFALVNAALQRIVAKDLASGTLFCEWGSGFGVVALLASLHGFDAHGIEIQPDLVEFAEQLAEEFACDVRFVQGTYVPPDGEKLAVTSENPWFDSGTSSAYQELEDRCRPVRRDLCLPVAGWRISIDRALYAMRWRRRNPVDLR